MAPNCIGLVFIILVCLFLQINMCSEKKDSLLEIRQTKLLGLMIVVNTLTYIVLVVKIICGFYLTLRGKKNKNKTPEYKSPPHFHSRNKNRLTVEIQFLINSINR